MVFVVRVLEFKKLEVAFNLNSEQLSQFVAELALAKKAEDIIIMDMREITNITDFFVICSGDSDIQIKAICDHIREQLEAKDVKIWHIEGYQFLSWVLIDLVNVVIHIFKPEVRDYYALERLWGDAKIIRVED